ncbi:MAG: gluconate 2-dehydrogenase subunit 3 family protein [Verrucomicrobiales bacterium]
MRTTSDTGVLSALAAGIIPADEMDEGAGCVNAGERLAQKMAAGIHTSLYEQGLKIAREIAAETYSRDVDLLSSWERHELLDLIRDRLPLFFKQLRMDVSAMYLSDPGVWQRIGFPGPSTVSGGYPDFDQPQIDVIHRLKEPLP